MRAYLFQRNFADGRPDFGPVQPRRPLPERGDRHRHLPGQRFYPQGRVSTGIHTTLYIITCFEAKGFD